MPSPTIDLRGSGHNDGDIDLIGGRPGGRSNKDVSRGEARRRFLAQQRRR